MHEQPPQTAPFWNDPRVRGRVFQAVLLAAVVGFLAYIVHNTLVNMQRQGIASGFGFLDDKAGFGIIMSLIDYSAASTYGRAFLVGLLNTLLVSALGIFFSTVIGFVIGVARLSPNWLIRKWAGVYIEVFRNIPLLLQIFFWYFAVLRSLPSPRNSIDLGGLIYLSNRGLYVPKPLLQDGAGWLGLAILPSLLGAMIFARWARRRRETTGRRLAVGWIATGIALAPVALTLAVVGMPVHWQLPTLGAFNFSGGLPLIPEFVSLLLALSVYTAAFIAENVRAGIESVSHGQREAAESLGLRSGQTLRLVIVPQALRVIIPPLTNQYLNLTKNSSLAAAIAYPDLVSVFAGTVLNQTGQAVEVIAITMAVYLTISLSIAAFMNWYDRRKRLIT